MEPAFPDHHPIILRLWGGRGPEPGASSASVNPIYRENGGSGVRLGPSFLLPESGPLLWEGSPSPGLLPTHGPTRLPSRDAVRHSAVQCPRRAPAQGCRSCRAGFGLPALRHPGRCPGAALPAAELLAGAGQDPPGTSRPGTMAVAEATWGQQGADQRAWTQGQQPGTPSSISQATLWLAKQLWTCPQCARAPVWRLLPPGTQQLRDHIRLVLLLCGAQMTVLGAANKAWRPPGICGVSGSKSGRHA